ncbi:MAG: phosphoadenylyl-sulfate reductase [Candidatus Paceibacterota bacterium]|jgi:phosphoadenosine phosphosulfate reductase
MNLKEKADISKNIIKLATEAYPKIFVACSFGKDSRVLLDLAMQVRSDITVAAIDTGYEFEETIEFGNSLSKELGFKLIWLKPSIKDVKRIDKEYGDSFIKNDQYKCCEMKIPAIERFVTKHHAWITGLRRDETEYRKDTMIVETGKVAKINPLAFWNNDDIWNYIRENKLRYHPLYDKGYPSLGCKPCTTSGKVRDGGGRQGQFERAGRFAGTKNTGGECGLHLKI